MPGVEVARDVFAVPDVASAVFVPDLKSRKLPKPDFTVVVEATCWKIIRSVILMSSMFEVSVKRNADKGTSVEFIVI